MKHVLSIILVGVVIFQTIQLSTLVHPIAAIEHRPNPLQEAAIKMGLGDPGEKILNAVTIASKQSGLSPEFILALMWTESSFKMNAVSGKNYQGLMQIPQRIHDEDINCLIGAKIFVEKLKITQGDYRRALILYKGWALNHPEGKRQADKVIQLTMKLKEV